MPRASNKLKLAWVILGLLLSPLSQAAPPFATAVVAYREVDQTYAAEALVEAVKQSTTLKITACV